MMNQEIYDELTKALVLLNELYVQGFHMDNDSVINTVINLLDGLANFEGDPYL